MANNKNKLKDYVKVCEDRWTGYIHADVEHIPIAVLVDPAISHEQRGTFEKVQSSDTAAVYRYSMTIQGREKVLYLKQYPYRSVIDAVKHLIRPSRAKRAFDAAMILEKHGLHTPEIVAFLQKKNGILCTEDILVTKEMKNATALQFLLTGELSLSKNDKRQMITELGKAVGHMHAAGICHGDMRGGNVFAAKEPDSWRFMFIDNERTIKYPILPFWRRRKNLVQLNIHRDNVSAADRMRFLRAYRQAAGISKKRSKRLARIVSKMTSKRLQRRAKTRTGLSGGAENTHWNFQMARFGNRSGIFLTQFAKADIAADLLKQIEHLMETGHVLKNDVSTRVVRCDYNGWDIVIKRYNHQGLWHSLRHTVKGSRARKCWRFGHILTAAGIACAAPLGVIEERSAGIVRQSYIINAFVEGPLLYVPMNDPNCSPPHRQAIVAKAQRVLEQLGENRLTHSDMKASNLIIAEGEPVLIDLDSMRQHRTKGPYFKNRYDKMVRTFQRRLDGKK
ncbi:MAG: lipopolysaccharide kinase InaA family protein [Planctomycetota bacterium]|jgi:tRNA A-37 threonylcarbamoyl transferase component Bud32